jgi:hypothetical protein
MDEEDGYFGERIAAGYDQSYPEMFEPSVWTRWSRFWRG